MNIGEVCSREVYIMRAGEPLREAVALMHRHQVGAIIVVEQDKDRVRPVGILTDRDVIYAQVMQGAEFSRSQVKDAMTTHPTTVLESAGLTEAISRMSDAGVRRAPVVDETGDLVGIITLDDLLPVISEELQGLARLIGGQAREGSARRSPSDPRIE